MSKDSNSANPNEDPNDSIPTDEPMAIDLNEQETKEINEKREWEKLEGEAKEKAKGAKKSVEKERDRRKHVHGKEMDKRQKVKDEIKRAPYKISMKLRLSNFAVGLLFILINSYFIVEAETTLNNATNYFALILLIMGLIRIIHAFYEDEYTGNIRLITFLFGFSLMILGIAVFIDPSFGRNTLISIISIGLILQGVARLLVGLFYTFLPLWFRTITFTIGVISVGFGGYILYSLDASNRDLILLLSYAFFFVGLGRLMRGFSGLSSRKQVHT